MWIKICANTNIEDAKLAAELGADAVGFVFAESARQVNPAAVAEMVTQLPDSVEKIGVFSSEDAEEIAEIVRQTGLTGVQLHGGFAVKLARVLDAEFDGRVTITQVLHWPVDHNLANASEFTAQLQAIGQDQTPQRVLIDSKTKHSIGGTGERFGWVAARAALTTAPKVRLIVAGGLNPDNVGRAVKELRPWGVDVASGVEASKGRKDPLKLKAFIEAVRKS